MPLTTSVGWNEGKAAPHLTFTGRRKARKDRTPQGNPTFVVEAGAIGCEIASLESDFACRSGAIGDGLPRSVRYRAHELPCSSIWPGGACPVVVAEGVEGWQMVWRVDQSL